MKIDCSALVPSACLPAGITDPRVIDCFTRRFNAATRQGIVLPETHTNNGDEGYADKCGTYSKCIKQDSPGKVNITAFNAFRAATLSGDFAAYEHLTLGGTRRLNGPMASYSYAFTGADGSQFGNATVAIPPKLNSDQYATELIELYWCSLLRDVAFTDYPSSAIAQDAATELSGAADYKGPKDGGTVTPALLFRGGFSGEDIGPYVSQFLLTPTNFGSAAFSQKYTTYVSNIDYMIDLDTWSAVQNGAPTGQVNQKYSTPRFLHDGRGLAAYTHVDELYQAYFTAYLVLNSIMPSPPLNPGNPYLKSTTQMGFGTFNGPDFAAVLGQVAKLALNSCWYQKWVVHLRHRPESGGGLVHLIRSGIDTSFNAQPLDRALYSSAVAQSFATYQTYLLSQPFPEGSPSHPAYPTGHGAVGGACITALKFFFDGDYVLNNPQMPTSDGTTITPWNYDPAIGKPGILTVNGELHKLAHNITFGHGLHGGIHWRSDSDASMMLGEAVAIRFFEDLVCTYAEPIDITITKLDGKKHNFKN